MADGDTETSAKRVLELCAMVQSMIDISAEHLDGLRTQCVTSAELTQQEIRTLEGKLIKLFCRQLVAKSKVPVKEFTDDLQQYPSLKQWLQVVGLSNKSIASICSKSKTLEVLLDTSEHDTKAVLQKSMAKDEEIRRLIIALRNLKSYTEGQLKGEKSNAAELDLHWDSWDRNSRASPRPPRTRAARSSVPSEELLKSTPTPPAYQAPLSPPANSLTQSLNMSKSATTSPHRPAAPWSPTPVSAAHHSQSSSNILPVGNTSAVQYERRSTPPSTPPIRKGKFPTTPPPSRRHNTGLSGNLVTPDLFPLNRSKSHEEHLGHRIDTTDVVLTSSENIPRRRLATEPGLENATDVPRLIPSDHISPQGVPASPVISPDQQNPDDNKSVRSPRMIPTVPGCMTHFIRHKLTFKPYTLKVTTCDFCLKTMIRGYKCKCCKYKCHRDCADKVPPSCGLPQEFLNVFSQTIKNNEGNHSPILSHHALSSLPTMSSDVDGRDLRWPMMMNQHSNANIPPFPPGPDSSSTSSCNSSTPSSPALIVTTNTPPGNMTKNQQFRFPEFLDSDKDVLIETRPIQNVSSTANENNGETTVDSLTSTNSNDMVETHKSNDSDKTISGTSHSGSTDSEKTLAGPIDSQDSQISDVDPNERGWPRQNSFSFREWDISYDELDIGQCLGTGRLGTVYRGNWHGNVAVKFLHVDDINDCNLLESFKQDVAMFHKTRHDNLVLFMGACMKPPLAIVTSLCRGKTLHTHIHVRKDKFNLSRSIVIAQQICQGMGYLHAKGIIHKDLKTKNIFYENGKVVITDFGLFSVTRLCHGNNRSGDWLRIPRGWLCYLSPEIIRGLRVSNQHIKNNLPFSQQSDIYAFGTVWYELLCGEWPFKNQPSESIIWQVGKGIKQSLTNVQSSRDVKEILMYCWSYNTTDRREFGEIAKMMNKLPKKRLARSPSHPIQLSRSAESVF